MLAQGGRVYRSDECPLFRVERTSTTMRVGLIHALVKTLPQCPCCGSIAPSTARREHMTQEDSLVLSGRHCVRPTVHSAPPAPDDWRRLAWRTRPGAGPALIGLKDGSRLGGTHGVVRQFWSPPQCLRSDIAGGPFRAPKPDLSTAAREV